MLKKYPDILLVTDIMEILKIGKAGDYKISKNDMIKYIRGKEVT
ncbi:MAG: hypothetical protein SOY60_04915 [Fusobacterium gastrosuis]|nr:hypothetical protein [Fusobacterium gastrosuis]